MKLIDADSFADKLRYMGYMDNNEELQELIDRFPEEKSRKGKWIRVGGYVTPGGDPVWRCSNCGKGRHVWGIEHNSYGADIADHQWVSCPNCGIEMEGEQW